MGFAIIRTKKLKSKSSITGALKHAAREVDTPNADPSQSQSNTVLVGPSNTNEIISAINHIIDIQKAKKKVRSNSVLTLEYLITASPEHMKAWSKEKQNDYLQQSLEWLIKKHGKENLVHASIHRDETTPHLCAYVVPIDNKGNLNCRFFTGGIKILSEMQSDFHSNIALKFGLDRGTKGSKARHQKIKRHYTKIQQPTPAFTITSAMLKPRKTGVFKKEKTEEVANRVNDELLVFNSEIWAKSLHFDFDMAYRNRLVELELLKEQKLEELDLLEQQNLARQEIDKQNLAELVKQNELHNQELVKQLNNISEITKETYKVLKGNYYSKEEKQEILGYIKNVDRRKQQGHYNMELKELMLDGDIPVSIIKDQLLIRYPLAVDPERVAIENQKKANATTPKRKKDDGNNQQSRSQHFF